MILSIEPRITIDRFLTKASLIQKEFQQNEMNLKFITLVKPTFQKIQKLNS